MYMALSKVILDFISYIHYKMDFTVLQEPFL